MDRTDLRLLGHLTRRPVASRAELAEVLGLSPSGAGKRRARLEADGVLRGFVAYPHPTVFGREAVAVGFDAAHDLEDLLAFEDVAWAATSVDGRAGMMAYSTDPVAWRAAAVARFGEPIQSTAMAPCQAGPLGPLEWRVLAACMDQPTGNATDLAAATGLSRRTVTARRTALLESGALRIDPIIRPSNNGDVAFHLFATCSEDARPAVLAAAGTHIELDPYVRGLYLFCLADNLAAHVVMERRIAALPGVERVDVVLNDRFDLNRKRLHGWIQVETNRWNQGVAS